MAIKVIFLDAGGTLVKVQKSVGHIYAKTAERHGFEVDVAQLNSAFRIAFGHAPPLAFPETPPHRLRDQEKAWWMDVVQDAFAIAGIVERGSAFNDLFEDLFQTFEGSNGWELYPEVYAVLRGFQERRIPMGIISNFDSRLDQIFVDLQVSRFFSSVTISSREGAAKPHPTIFRRALAKHRIAPHEGIHVGDSLRDDVEGATTAGLRAVMLSREPNADLPDGITTISTLTELLSLPELIG